MGTLKKHNAPFTQIPNKLLNDRELSLSCKGIYAFMMSKPDDWNFTIASMSKQLKEGQDAIKSALKALKESGWITYTKFNDGRGVYELNLDNTPKVENPHEGNPLQGKSTPISNKDSLVINIDTKQSKQSTIARSGLEQVLVDYRKSIKKPIKTVRGLDGLIKNIYQTAEKHNMRIDKVIETMMENEWQTIKPEYLANNNKQVNKPLLASDLNGAW
jgi:hypothetical protein